jgi:hypothetical protein
MSNSKEVEFDDSQFRARMQEYLQKAPAAARGAMRDAGEQIIGDAQAICPVDKGTLQASGTVDDSNLESGNELVIGFDTDYAAVVHERLDVHHPQGQAKYLETAVKNDLPRIGRTIAEEVAAVQ